MKPQGSFQEWKTAKVQMEAQMTDEQLREVDEHIQEVRDDPCRSTVSTKMTARRCETVNNVEAGIILSGRMDTEKCNPNSKSSIYTVL